MACDSYLDFLNVGLLLRSFTGRNISPVTQVDQEFPTLPEHVSTRGFNEVGVFHREFSCFIRFIIVFEIYVTFAAIATSIINRFHSRKI